MTTPPRLVVALYGPPGAGKTTLARASGLTVYDRDDPEWTSERQFTQALARLNEDPTARAVVIRSGASSSAREKTNRKIGATHAFIVDTDKRTCEQRVRARGRADKVTTLCGIYKWWDLHDPHDGIGSFPGWDSIGAGTTTTAMSRSW